MVPYTFPFSLRQLYTSEDLELGTANEREHVAVGLLGPDYLTRDIFSGSIRLPTHFTSNYG